MKNKTRGFYLFKIVLIAFVLLWFIPVSAFSADQYTFIDLGTLGGNWSYPYAVNDIGQVVGESSTAVGSQRAFLWENGTMTNLGSLGHLESMGSYANGINNSGQVVGYSTNGNWWGRAFLWQSGVMSDLGTLAGGEGSAVAYGINNSGQVVGTSQTPESLTYGSNYEHAFLWEDGVMRDLGTLGGIRSNAFAINNSGQVVGESWTDSAQNSHAFLWEDGVMRDLDTLGGNTSEAFNINDSGSIVGRSKISSGSEHAFILENGTMTDLGTLGGDISGAFGINNSGQVVGNSRVSGNGQSLAFLWENGTMKDLNEFLPSGSGGLLYSADAINDAGWIVGRAVIGNRAHGFLMKPTVTPEPLSCALFLVGGGALFARRRFCKRA